jgi:hypothetical protein
MNICDRSMQQARKKVKRTAQIIRNSQAVVQAVTKVEGCRNTGLSNNGRMKLRSRDIGIKGISIA